MENSNEKKKENSSEQDYEVGYKKPPVENQFKKGQSGNPRGRIPRSTTLRESISRALAQKITIKENGKNKKLVVIDILAKKMINNALSGNAKALELLLKEFGTMYVQEEIAKVYPNDPQKEAEQRERYAKIKEFVMNQIQEKIEKEAE